MYYDAALMAPTSAAGAATIRKLRNIGNPKPDDDGARLAHFRSAAVTRGGYPDADSSKASCAARVTRAAQCVTMTTAVLYRGETS